MKIEARIKELGIELPGMSAPKAMYVPVVQTGNLCFVSGQLPMIGDQLCTGKVGETRTLEEAQEILRKHKIEKLPIVDDDFNLKGLITIKDIEKAVQYPNSARDVGGRLLCGAAIGATADVLDRVAALVAAGVDVVSLDSAHGHSMNIYNAVKNIKAKFPNAPVIAGNIATKGVFSKYKSYFCLL